jgi:hypothetical protein
MSHADEFLTDFPISQIMITSKRFRRGKRTSVAAVGGNFA